MNNPAAILTRVLLSSCDTLAAWKAMNMVKPFLYRLSLKAPASWVRKKGRNRGVDNSFIESGMMDSCICDTG